MAKKKKQDKSDKKKDAQDQEGPENDEPLLPPISPGKRRRLQTAFDHGTLKGSKGEFDYAHEMFAQCVAGDPGNVIYTQNLIGNLIKKYNNNPKSAKRPGMKDKNALKKAISKKDWVAAIKPGMGCLKQNPWDPGILKDLATACGHLEVPDCQLLYMNLALEGNPKDMSLNNAAADMFEEMGEFDRAILCLQRVLKEKDSEEIRRRINSLSVMKTINKGGYEEAETSIDVSVTKRQKDSETSDVEEVSQEEKMRREIRRHPDEVTTYQALADYYVKEENFQAAIEVMKEGVEGTGGAIKAKEYLEDMQIMDFKRKILVAERRAREEAKANNGKPREDRDVKAQQLYKSMKKELNQRELEMYASRCERNPSLYGLKYEFGLRLKRAGKFNDAITQFQEARNEPRKVAASNLEIGECFQQIKQYKLALKAYDEAIQTCGQWDEEVRKLSLYRAGWLAKGLKDWPTSEKYLEELAGLDFSFKDVSELLDEVVKHRGETDLDS